jgi:hypothetical protein
LAEILVKKGKSIHLLEPLTSKPIIGTKTKKIKQIKNSNIDILNMLLSDIEEKKIKKIIPIPINAKCLKKK